jgi:hypothetical protein
MINGFIEKFRHFCFFRQVCDDYDLFCEEEKDYNLYKDDASRSDKYGLNLELDRFEKLDSNMSFKNILIASTSPDGYKLTKKQFSELKLESPLSIAKTWNKLFSKPYDNKYSSVLN